MVKELFIKGYCILIDEPDFESVSKFNWSIVKGRNTYYANTTINGKLTGMHRYLMNTPKGLVTDHINHNGLDNRRCNLRISTISDNRMNVPFISVAERRKLKKMILP